MQGFRSFFIVILFVCVHGLGIGQEMAHHLEKTGKKISIQVKDAVDKTPIPNFLIDFTSCGHSKYESNDKGVFSMEAFPGFSCYVLISNSGYTPTEILLEYKEIVGNEKNYDIYLSRSPNRYSGTIKDKANSNHYIPDVFIELKNSKEKEIQREYSNAGGAFSLLLKPDSEYEIQLHHPKYQSVTKFLSTGKKIGPDFLGIWYLDPIPGYDSPESGTPLYVKDKYKPVEGSYKKPKFSVQVYATSFEISDPGRFQDILGDYGKVFFNKNDEIIRVRVGHYLDRSKAEQILSRIRQETEFTDAFLTQEFERVTETESFTSTEGSGLRYYVRLASYLNPEYFRPDSVMSLGTVMELRKEEWTIFLLAQFESVEDARKVKDEAVSRGFGAAEIVYFDEGIIRKAQY